MDKKYKEFWIVSDGDKYPKGTAHLAYSWDHKYGHKIQVVEHAALKAAEDEIAKLREALESIAATDVIPEQCHGYFEGYHHYELVDCLSNDTELARKVLKESKERWP